MCKFEPTGACNFFTFLGTECYLLASCDVIESCPGCVCGPTAPSFADCPWPPAPTTGVPTTTALPTTPPTTATTTPPPTTATAMPTTTAAATTAAPTTTGVLTTTPPPTTAAPTTTAVPTATVRRHLRRDLRGGPRAGDRAHRAHQLGVGLPGDLPEPRGVRLLVALPAGR